MFVNRKTELNEMKRYAELIAAGKKINLSVFGLRRIGKTELLLEFKRICNRKYKTLVVPYINLHSIVLESRLFVFHILLELLHEIHGFEKPKTIEDLFILSNQLSKSEQECVRFILNYSKSELNEEDFLKGFFEHLVNISKSNKIIYIIDEFQDILQANKNVLKIIRAVTEKEKNLNFLVAGSIVTAMRKIFHHNEPFFGQFMKIRLENFDNESSYELIKSFRINKEVIKKRVAYLTKGHPYYISVLCSKIDNQMDKKTIDYNFIKELYSKDGLINEHFEYLMDLSIAKFKNKTVYKNILVFLSEKNHILIEIARYLKKDIGETNKYVSALNRIGLIERHGNYYSIKDKLFSAWLKKIHLGISEPDLQEDKIKDMLIKQLEEKYLRAKTDLGFAKEYEIREKLKKLSGIVFEPYRKDDIEFDAVGLDKEAVIIAEIKWRNRETNYKDVENFINKINSSEFSSRKKKLLFISKEGFTEQAKKLLKEHNIEIVEIV